MDGVVVDDRRQMEAFQRQSEVNGRMRIGYERSEIVGGNCGFDDLADGPINETCFESVRWTAMHVWLCVIFDRCCAADKCQFNVQSPTGNRP